MRATFLGTVATIILTASSALAQSEDEFPAKLAGHLVMPAATFIDAPADAPAGLKTSGKYTTGKRVDALGTVMGKSYERATGVSLPFKGQPLQGHSGIKSIGDGTFWVHHRQRHGRARQFAGFDPVPQPLQDGLGRRQDRAAGDRVPARSRQTRAVPHRA